MIDAAHCSVVLMPASLDECPCLAQPARLVDDERAHRLAGRVPADVQTVLFRPRLCRPAPAHLGQPARPDVAPPVRQPLVGTGLAGDRVGRLLPGADGGIPVREADGAEAGMGDEHEVAAGVDAGEPGNGHVGADLDGPVDLQPGRRHHASAHRRDDDVGLDAAVLVTNRHEAVHGDRELLDGGAADEGDAELLQRRGGDGGERVVETVERLLEQVEDRDRVPLRREGRRGLDADQPASDHDDPVRAAGERRRQPSHPPGCRVDVGDVEAGNPRRPVREPRRQDDRVGLEVLAAGPEPPARQVDLVDHRVQALDAALGQPLLVGQQDGLALHERRLRQRRAVDGQAGADQEWADPVAGEPHRAGGAGDAVPDDRDLGPHAATSPTRSTTSRHQAG